jgi:hypothetical protein
MGWVRVVGLEVVHGPSGGGGGAQQEQKHREDERVRGRKFKDKNVNVNRTDSGVKTRERTGSAEAVVS